MSVENFFFPVKYGISPYFARVIGVSKQKEKQKVTDFLLKIWQTAGNFCEKAQRHYCYMTRFLSAMIINDDLQITFHFSQNCHVLRSHVQSAALDFVLFMNDSQFTSSDRWHFLIFFIIIFFKYTIPLEFSWVYFCKQVSSGVREVWFTIWV